MERLISVTDGAEQVADEILAFTSCHPYYIQELAFKAILCTFYTLFCSLAEVMRMFLTIKMYLIKVKNITLVKKTIIKTL